ncbi:MAG: ice-binding family protein [Balneolaceae bacterium]|nr:ice-binding family protein [Balneolaceae bacterium]
MKSINTYLNMNIITAVLLAVFMAGCNNNSTGPTEEPDIDPPTVTATSPESDATGIKRNIAVTIAFSEPMDPTTINETTFTLKQGSSAVEGDVSYAGTTTTFTATFTPVNPLNASEVYTAAISVGAKSSKGVALESKTEWSFTTGGSTEALEVVDLGTSGDYVILAKTAINNVPTSAITGDLGLSPAATSFITGFALTDNTGYATSDQVTGRVYAADMAAPTPSNLTTAVENMITAYNDAAGRPNPDFVELHTGDISGKTLSPGLYKWTNTVTAAVDVVLSGGENDVWIFQIANNLSVSSDVNFTLSGGAQAKNIFWQVAGEVTIGTGSHFEGIILSMTGITLSTGASMNGRLLAQTAAILDGNTIVEVN